MYLLVVVANEKIFSDFLISSGHHEVTAVSFGNYQASSKLRYAMLNWLPVTMNPVRVEIVLPHKIRICVPLSAGHDQEHNFGNQLGCIKPGCRLSDGLRLFSEGTGWTAIHRWRHSGQDAGPQSEERYFAATSAGEVKQQLFSQLWTAQEMPTDIFTSSFSNILFTIFLHAPTLISIPSWTEETVPSSPWWKWPKICSKILQTFF